MKPFEENEEVICISTNVEGTILYSNCFSRNDLKVGSKFQIKGYRFQHIRNDQPEEQVIWGDGHGTVMPAKNFKRVKDLRRLPGWF